MNIGNRQVGPGKAVYVIAELSANHNQDFGEAERLVREAKNCGADAVKLQTYTPDTMTIRSDRPEFRIGGGTIWDGRTLYDLYGEAYTRWDWQPRLKRLAEEIGIQLFSTPFDATAVDFLEDMDVPAYKVASFEIVDLALIEKIARTGKPMIMSTGMATLVEIAEAVEAARGAGAGEIALLKCTSGYPASPDEMHLRTIPNMAEAFQLPVGLSDHTLGSLCRWPRWPWGPASSRSISRCPAPCRGQTALFRWNRPSSRPWSRRCGPPKRRWGKCITA